MNGSKYGELKNGRTLPDERQQSENSLALTTGVILGILFDCSMMIYYFVTRNVEKAYPYVAQIVVIACGFCLVSLRKGDVTLPKTLFGKTVDPGSGRRAFLSRLSWALLDSLEISVVLTLFDVYTERGLTGSFVVDGMIMFLIWSVLNICWVEVRVRRYRRNERRLDEDENNLD